MTEAKTQERYEAAVDDLGLQPGSLEAQLLWDYTRSIQEAEAAGRQGAEWIPCDERLPDEGQLCVVLSEHWSGHDPVSEVCPDCGRPTGGDVGQCDPGVGPIGTADCAAVTIALLRQKLAASERELSRAQAEIAGLVDRKQFDTLANGYWMLHRLYASTLFQLAKKTDATIDDLDKFVAGDPFWRGACDVLRPGLAAGLTTSMTVAEAIGAYDQTRAKLKERK